MKIIKVIVFIFLVTWNFKNYSQNSTTFGAKGGGNLSQFSSNEENDFKFKPGFYIGLFTNLKISENFSFQPEILFALQGTKATSEIEIRDSAGNPLPNTAPFDFTYEVNDFSLVIPLVFRYDLSKKLYLELGPQLAFVLDSTLTSSQTLLDGTGSELESINFTNFDFGINIGTGYKIDDNIYLNLRATNGLSNRDNDVKSFQLNLGIEYEF